MRITAKGQVTIPVELRERTGLLPHTEVEIELDGEAVRIVRARPGDRARPSGRGESRGERAVRLLRGRATAGMSTDGIMRLTRGDDDDNGE